MKQLFFTFVGSVASLAVIFGIVLATRGIGQAIAITVVLGFLSASGIIGVGVNFVDRLAKTERDFSGILVALLVIVLLGPVAALHSPYTYWLVPVLYVFGTIGLGTLELADYQQQNKSGDQDDTVQERKPYYESDGGWNCIGTNQVSFDEWPQEIKGNLLCANNHVTSYHNIHKHIKRVDGYIACDKVSHMLGLALIPGVKKVIVMRYPALSKLINDNLKDVLRLQEALLDAGYREQAQL